MGLHPAPGLCYVLSFHFSIFMDYLIVQTRGSLDSCSCFEDVFPFFCLASSNTDVMNCVLFLYILFCYILLLPFWSLQLSNERQKWSEIIWDENWGRMWRSRGTGNYSGYIKKESIFFKWRIRNKDNTIKILYRYLTRYSDFKN